LLGTYNSRGPGDESLKLVIEPLKCICCGLCETACSLGRDGVLTPTTSSIMLHVDDKADYFGLVVKSGVSALIIARPEGASEGRQAPGASGPGAKPILLREPCDLCKGKPKCVKVCPTRSIRTVD